MDYRYPQDTGVENPYYKTAHDIYNVANEQFWDYLQREGTVVSDYWTGNEYRCFFRRNKDTNQTNDNISFYYPANPELCNLKTLAVDDYPRGVEPGSLINFSGKTYLVLNQESLENKAYRRSDAINADVMLSAYNPKTGEEINLPCFAYDLTSTTPTQADSHMFVEINGNVEMMTGDNEETRKLGIDYEFNAMGNWYSIVSINYKTGIARIVASVIVAPSNQPERSLSVNIDGSYTQGEEAQFHATAFFGDQIVSNATLEWTSSDAEIVTVSKSGHAEFVGVGSCYVTCTWKEHNISKTAFVQVNAVPVELVCTITGKDSITSSGSATYTATFYQEDGKTEDTTITPVWSLSVPDAIKSLVSISAQSGNTITIKVGKGAQGKSIGLELTDESEAYHASKTIALTSWL
jgi:hypothetical protein|nr:MAG TPA: SURFACE LAYER PROTEIN BINDING PROTEIN, S-LAYER, SBSC.8A [Caudoviricetes sp.]